MKPMALLAFPTDPIVNPGSVCPMWALQRHPLGIKVTGFLGQESQDETNYLISFRRGQYNISGKFTGDRIELGLQPDLERRAIQWKNEGGVSVAIRAGVIKFGKNEFSQYSGSVAGIEFSNTSIAVLPDEQTAFLDFSRLPWEKAMDWRTVNNDRVLKAIDIDQDGIIPGKVGHIDNVTFVMLTPWRDSNEVIVRWGETDGKVTVNSERKQGDPPSTKFRCDGMLGSMQFREHYEMLLLP